MTDGASGGAHRARRTRVDTIRGLLAPLAAVAAVAGLIGVLLYVNGEDTPQAGPIVASSPRSSHVRSEVPDPTVPATPPASQPVPPAPATTAPPPAPAPTTPQAAEPASRAPLTVLNNSRRSGLATRAAADFERGGWTVVHVGNFTGRIPVTTVYFAPGQEQTARALAQQFPAIQRVLPRFDGLPGSGLTVVVTREYPG